ncbi:hypothetical protein [Bdellovibrio bacteriovorus]|uniref:Antitoxin n=2 Tax=Bdellovibrio bacteriovorus TaxID=959 RepID=Q6MMC8_BDEBA|nr:hypothetical protein [Bdellovibrio bacteriovorus]AHZ84232.1 hypothetical protein EP01_04650 [Bdellovibrio bacteriovorus]ASD63957.1 hypothetical protein B9G79_10440 [Bdellovibrio bacteriovorus]BEV68117.1 hypothetical protein Bb109J_c1537 [Bdellovibrio bacteriovorus]CAE79577.1 conserved hypothetical protein [Bdellovibrio bacteriovorus HD100]
MKRKRIPTQKELEDNFSSWKSVSKEKVAAINARNEVLRREKEKKEAKFTARLTQADFEGFKAVAERKGIPYQTLLGFVIHAYVQGSLVDVEEIRKVFPALKLKKEA